MLFPDRFFFLLILSFFFIACHGGQEISSKEAFTTNIPQPPLIDKPVAVPWRDVLNKMIIGSFSEKEDGEALALEIKNVQPYTDRMFETFLLELGKLFHASQVNYKVVSLQAGGTGGTFYKATLFLADMNAYSSGTISEPELLRRAQIETVETVASLKEKVKGVRKSGDNEEAGRLLEKWLTLEPANATALALLGNVNRDKKKYWEAIPVYKKILDLDSRSIFANHNLGYCYERVGDYESALASYQKALEVDSKNVVLMKQIAMVCEKNGDYNGTMVWLNKARALKDEGELWMIEGNVKRDAKKFTEASAAYIKGQKLTPEDYRLLFNRLLVDLDTKNFSEAKKKYTELGIKDPVLAQELAGIYLFQ